MGNRSKIILVLVIFVFLSSLVGAEAFFSKNLRFGERGDDILQLQKVLNKDLKTKVAPSGPGSPGEETSYFGSLTYDAVVRFQELHKDEILSPIGLSFGTGFVGTLTRSKLNSLDNEQVVGSADIDLGDVGEEGFVAILLRTVPDVARGGHFVSLYGYGFLKSDEVYVAGIKSPQVNFKNSELMTFLIPQGLSQGDNLVKLKRGEAFTNEVLLKVILPGQNIDLSPKITEIIPASGPKGTVVTIKGEGFGESNIVYLGYDMLSNVRSTDGKTISVIIDPAWATPRDSYSASMPFWIYVDNGERISNSKIFEFKI